MFYSCLTSRLLHKLLLTNRFSTPLAPITSYSNDEPQLLLLVIISWAKGISEPAYNILDAEPTLLYKYICLSRLVFLARSWFSVQCKDLTPEQAWLPLGEGPPTMKNHQVWFQNQHSWSDSPLLTILPCSDHNASISSLQATLLLAAWAQVLGQKKEDQHLVDKQ